MTKQYLRFVLIATHKEFLVFLLRGNLALLVSLMSGQVLTSITSQGLCCVHKLVANHKSGLGDAVSTN